MLPLNARQALDALRDELRALAAVLAATEPAQLAEAVLDGCARLLVADGAMLLSCAPGGNLVLAGTRGESLPLAPEDIDALIAEQPSPLLLAIGAAGAEPRPAGPLLVYPLLAAGRLVGVLAAVRERPPFGAADLERVALLAAQARVALDNLRLTRHAMSSDRLVALGRATAGVAHEIRNPLTYVLASVEEIVRLLRLVDAGSAAADALPLARLAEMAAHALDGAERMRAIVREIGALANAEETSRIRFDLNDAIRAAVRITGAELRGRLVVMLRLCEPAFVVGSSGRLTQVFVNLLENASQASGSQPGQMVIVSRLEGARIVVEATDDGPGIPADALVHLFEPFFTTKRPDQGTGLGLYLSREILRRHGGDVRVSSCAGRGTTFTIDLPQAPTCGPAPSLQASGVPLAPAELAAGSQRLETGPPLVAAPPLPSRSPADAVPEPVPVEVPEAAPRCRS